MKDARRGLHSHLGYQGTSPGLHSRTPQRRSNLSLINNGTTRDAKFDSNNAVCFPATPILSVCYVWLCRNFEGLSHP